MKRYLNLLELLDKKSSFVFGPRACGKSYAIREQFQDVPHLKFDLLRGSAYMRYVSDPSLLGNELRTELSKSRGQKPLIVIIDEIQKIPLLLDEVHSLIEDAKNQIRFLLTGSSARKLKRGGANLLAGRALTKYMHPLSSLELDLDLTRALRFGTLPEIYLTAGQEVDTLESYVTTYVREEIQEESIVRNVDKFSRFIDLSAQYNGEPINFSKLSRAINVSTKTCQEYFEIMVDTLICSRLDGWNESTKRQLMQAPKFYFFDCGVLNSITGEVLAELKPSSFRYGRLFETFIMQEIQTRNDYLNLKFRMNYWRDKNSREVDLILSRQLSTPLCAIEIKSSEMPTLEDIETLLLLKEEYPKIKLLCLSRTVRPYKIQSIDVLPWQDGLKALETI